MVYIIKTHQLACTCGICLTNMSDDKSPTIQEPYTRGSMPWMYIWQKHGTFVHIDYPNHRENHASWYTWNYRA